MGRGGEPLRKYLWILSRTLTMDETGYQGIIKRLPQRDRILPSFAEWLKLVISDLCDFGVK
jgi:hypothetical protein